MKKILLIVVLLCSFTTVNAKSYLQNDLVSYQNTNTNVCISSQKYPIYQIKYQNKDLFFLNYALNYNFNFDDYYEIGWEESPYNVALKEYLGYSHLWDDIGLDVYYPMIITRILWENAHDDLALWLCDPKGALYNTLQEQMKAIYANVKNGPNIAGVYTLKEDEAKEFAYPYFSYYEITANDGLDVTLKKDKLLVSGKSGRYTLVLDRKGNTLGESKLYTDGVNFLASTGNMLSKKVVLNFEIALQNLVIKSADAKENICYKIYQDDKLYDTVCTDETGKVEVKIPLGIFAIIRDKFEDYQKFETVLEVNGDANIYDPMLKEIKNTLTSIPKEDLSASIEENVNESNLQQDEISKDDDVVIITDGNAEQIIFTPEDTFIIS